MINDSSNAHWKTTQSYQGFELRAHRFREDMLPVFYKWLGIGEESRVLDGGCGTGVFTRFLAKGLTTGHITGFDINETFIAFGKTKLAELGLLDKVTLEVADGYRLPYPEGSFDAVTNYTYTGVLSDMKAGLSELIRVLRPGGVVSCVIGSNTIARMAYHGAYPFQGADRLQPLAEREWAAFSGMQKARSAGQLSELALLSDLGLSEIHMYPFSHLICYSDTNFPAGYRKTLALSETAEEINWLNSRYTGNKEAYAERGFTDGDFRELTGLLERKLDYLTRHFESDMSYEWHGGLNYIVTGRK